MVGGRHDHVLSSLSAIRLQPAGISNGHSLASGGDGARALLDDGLSNTHDGGGRFGEKVEKKKGKEVEVKQGQERRLERLEESGIIYAGRITGWGGETGED